MKGDQEMYPNQPQAYAPQFPQQPAYPAQQYPQQPAYPVQPAYPPQGYAQPTPAQPLPSVGLDDFFSQPSGGAGPSFKFMDANRQPQIGKTYSGIVARPITNADVRAQTDQAGRPQTYRDGRVKSVMVVPMLVPQSPEFPEGQAGWWVKGQARDELARAMAEAGAPAGAPEAGAGITVTLVSTRNVPNMNPQYIYAIRYVRPQGAAPVPQGGPVEQHNNPAAPVAQVQQAAPPAPVQQVAPPAPVQQPAPAPVQQAMPAGLNPDQQKLFAQLTGGQS